MDTLNQSCDLESPSKGSTRVKYPVVGVFGLYFGALIAVFLAGGPHQGAMGIFLLISGLILTVLPPQQAFPWRLFGVATLFLLAVSLAALPEKWFGVEEEWKKLLQEASLAIPGFLIPSCISGDPLNTLFWILILSASIFAAFYCLASPLTSGEMENIALIICIGCSLYTLLAIAAWTTGWSYPFFIKESWIQPAFGFFPNRNHSAAFLLSGSIISLGLIHRGVRKHRFFVSLVAAGSFVLLTGSLLFFSISRGGLLFLLLGVLIWVFGLGKHRSSSLIFLGTVLSITMIILFIHSGSGLIARLEGGISSNDVTPGELLSTNSSSHGRLYDDPRASIQRDTITMIANHPVAGTGLGTYALVYPFYANLSLRPDTALHAESDWLTLCAECGIPALLLVLVLIGMLFAGIPMLTSQSAGDWPLRWAFLSAFSAELLHGLVDVPLHRPELGWWIMLLGGVGFAHRRTIREEASDSLGLQRGLFIAGGIASVLIGGVLIYSEWGGGLPLPPFSSKYEGRRLVKLSFKGDPDSIKEAIFECRRAINEHPLNHLLYYQLALLSIQRDKNYAEAKRLFEVERALSPNDPAFVFEQGKLLADADPNAAASIWSEALRRQLELESRSGSTIPKSLELFQSMIATAAEHPALLSQLPSMVAQADPALRIAWYERPECDPILIEEAVRDKSLMGELDSRQRGHLVELWFQHHGDPKLIAGFMDSHPDYASVTAATRAELLSSVGQQKEACQFLVKTFHLQIPKANTGGILPADQDVPEEPIEAARYYMERKNDVAARRILSEILDSQGNQANRGDALFLLAVMDLRVENWIGALNELLGFLRATGQL